MFCRILFPALLAVLLQGCVTAYIPFVSEPGYAEIIAEGVRLYPEMFRKAPETEKIGSPSIYIAVNENTVTGSLSVDAAITEISEAFIQAGFPVAENEKQADMIISGSFSVSADSDKNFGGFTDCQAKYRLEAVDAVGHTLTSVEGTVRGMGLTVEDSIVASLANAGRESSKNLIRKIISVYRSRSVVYLEIYNLGTLHELHAFYLKLKEIRGVNNVWMLDYRGANAYFDVSVAYGGSAGNLARGLMETFGTSLKMNRPSLMELEAAVQVK